MRVENLFLFFEKVDMMKRMIINIKNVMDVLKNKVKARLFFSMCMACFVDIQSGQEKYQAIDRQ